MIGCETSAHYMVTCNEGLLREGTRGGGESRREEGKKEERKGEETSGESQRTININS